jgi:hypothetical protein
VAISGRGFFKRKDFHAYPLSRKRNDILLPLIPLFKKIRDVELELNIPTKGKNNSTK